LDGVIAEIDLFKLRSIDFETREETRKELESWYYKTCKVQFDPSLLALPEDEIIIITSRDEPIKEITYTWLKKHNIPYNKIIFAHLPPGNYIGGSLTEWFKRMAELKAKILKEEQIDIYFEDTPQVVRFLRELCPSISIVVYGDRSE
jgi:hypothetical protein